MRKSIIIPVTAAIIIGGVIFSAGQTFAQATVDPQQNIIQKLSEKLGISQDKVKSAFEEIHGERQTEMKANIEQKLTQAVTEGKIIETQKQAILTKFSEMHQNHRGNFQEFKSMTPEQRKQAKDSRKSELETWAQQNGINLETIKEIFPQARGKFMMRHW